MSPLINLFVVDVIAHVSLQDVRQQFVILIFEQVNNLLVHRGVTETWDGTKFIIPLWLLKIPTYKLI